MEELNKGDILNKALLLYRQYNDESERVLSKHYGKDYLNNPTYHKDLLILEEKKFYQPVNELRESIYNEIGKILNTGGLNSILKDLSDWPDNHRESLVNDLVMKVSLSAEKKEWKATRDILLRDGIPLLPNMNSKLKLALRLFGFYYPADTFHKLIDKIKFSVDKDYPVLIIGESGTGKELLARTIHELSNKRKDPFVPINCNAIQSTLFESQLFGHKKGAFTGAIKDYPGLLKSAGDGTVFLDEIGDLGIAEQIKLLRVLQEEEFFPVGSTKPEKLGARMIYATNQKLTKLVKEGKFRNDLYHRINTVKIILPSLSNTLMKLKKFEDRKLLLKSFLYRVLREDDRYRHGVVKVSLTDEAVEKLSCYTFPGNYRELMNIFRSAFFRNYKNVIDDKMIEFDDEPEPEQSEKPLDIEKMTYDEVEAAGESYKNKLIKEKLLQLMSKHRGHGVLQNVAMEIGWINRGDEIGKRKNAGSNVRKLAESLRIDYKNYSKQR